MCSGRVDLEFIFRAFANGEDSVFVGGCKLGECNYVTHGNFDALANVYLSKKLLEKIGVNPERLTIEFMSGGDGPILAEVIDKFSVKTRELGRIGEAEGISKEDLALRIESVRMLIPYLRLVERERFRVPQKTSEAYTAFWQSEETIALFDRLIDEKLAVSQIMTLLGEKSLSTADISEALGLNPSRVAKYMNASSRQGLVKYDTQSNCYALT